MIRSREHHHRNFAGLADIGGEVNRESGLWGLVVDNRWVAWGDWVAGNTPEVFGDIESTRQAVAELLVGRSLIRRFIVQTN
ncbi:MAG: hypothetical protein R3C44_05830 [Chloroflexota bacterium]